mmetsp:Transcript_44997/g.89114  ORF Transcript_44997/g.89114 Transcript_44997/m.89114 type:complete len:664 (+) Transcript_44997:206-2197(+)
MQGLPISWNGYSTSDLNLQGFPRGTARPTLARKSTTRSSRGACSSRFFHCGNNLFATAACVVAGLQASRGQGKGTKRKQVVSARHCQADAAGVKLGGIAPSDPLLLDERRFGEGIYSHADLCGWFQTAPEYGWTDCELEGSLPNGLEGTLYMVGPGRFERGDQIYKHFLDGDGFVSAWCLKGGRVTSRGGFVCTPEYVAEESAGKILFRGAFGTAKEGGTLANTFDIRSKNLANTNVIVWGGRMLALYEACHPSRLNADDLSFSGYDNLGGILRPGISASTGIPLMDALLGMGGDAFTAHPKMDPVLQSLVGFTWSSEPEGVKLRVLAFDQEFRRLHQQEPDCEVSLCLSKAQPHDFGLTNQWCVFLENQLDMPDVNSFLLGQKGPAECLIGRPDLPQYIHLAPRRSGRPNVVVQGATSGFDIHVPHCHDGPPLAGCNAARGRSDMSLVTIYSTGWDVLPAGPFLGTWTSDKTWDFELPKVAVAMDFNEGSCVRLIRQVVDANTGELLERCPVPGCEALCVEHPTINRSFTGNPGARYIYMSTSNEKGIASPMCGWSKVDLLSGDVQTWWAGSRCFTDELHFVPRRGPGGTWTPGLPETSEDDGWLLGIAADIGKKKSFLCVFDASRDLRDGPVCKVWLPHVLPHGLHGSFIPASSNASTEDN